MAMGFSVLGFMIVVNQHDGSASITGGILGILLGTAFLIAACLHLTRCGQIQRGFLNEWAPAFRPDRGLLLWRDPITSANAN